MTAVHGICDERFAGVKSELERNLRERGEIGASVCITVDGKTVVDLWGGIADPATGREWERDTLCAVFSCTKGTVGLAAHVLADSGELDLDRPVADYWPEFAQGGKNDVTVAMLLNHQAGVPAFREPIDPYGFCDWELVTDRLAREESHWEPGTRHGYHALTFGHTTGEVIRRITGQSFGTFFRERIAEPLGIEFYIGLATEHEDRLAPTTPADPPQPGERISDFYQAAMTEPTSLAAFVLMNNGGLLLPGMMDSKEVHAAEIPAVNGVSNGRGLAGLYRPLALGGSVDGVTLVSEERVAEMATVTSASTSDAIMRTATRFTTGFMPSIDNHRRAPGQTDSVLLSTTAFGYLGMGGSIGFADPDARLSFGYSMNKQGSSTGLNDRGQALVDATYSALGYRRIGAAGTWCR